MNALARMEENALMFDLRRTAARRVCATAVAWHASGGTPRTIAYDELVSLAETAARGLHALGVRPGDRVADFCDEGPSVVLAILAIGCAGAVLVPLDPAAPPLRLRRLILDSQPAIALCSAGSAMVRLAGGGGASGASTHSCDAPACTSRAFFSEEERPASDCAGCELGVKTVTLELLLELGRSFQRTQREAAASGSTATEQGPAGESLRRAGSLPLSHLVYTSGSSGTPKGVACPAAALHSYCLAKVAAQRIDASSRVLLASAHTWDPCVGDVWSTLSAGGTLCLVSR